MRNNKWGKGKEKGILWIFPRWLKSVKDPKKQIDNVREKGKRKQGLGL